MQPTDHLFRLIKSLEPSEKGYFKKFASGYGKTQNYLLIFDAIDAQESYDEPALLHKFRKQPFSRQFSVAKNYLWELILKSQRQYRAEGSKFVQLNTLLENGEILFEKGLYDEAMRAWDKAAKLAEAYDEKPFQLDIETARRRYYIEMTASNWQTYSDPSYAKSAALLHSYGHMLDIQQKYVQIIQYIKTQPFFKTDEQRTEWARFMEDPILQVDREPEDFYGRLYFFYIHNIYHLLCRNKHEALAWIQKVVALWDAQPDLKAIEPIKYISAVNNYLTNLFLLGEQDAYCQYVEQFNPPKGFSKSQSAVIFEHVWVMRSNYYVLKKDIAGYGKMIADTLPEIHNYGPLINQVRLLIIKYSMASYYTFIGEIEQSNNLLTEIVESKEVALRKDLQSVSRVLQMINHFEAGNLMLLEHLMRSSKHFMRRNDMYYETEKLFFKHFSLLMKAPDKTARKAVASQMHAEILDNFNNNDAERFVFDSMHLMEWIEKYM